MARNKGLHKSEAWLKLRRAQNQTYEQMAAEAGVSIEMIRKSLKGFGIK